MNVRLWLLAGLLLFPFAVGAVDFSEYDMLPRTQQLAFDHDRLYFHVTLTQPKLTDAWFAFDRKTHELVVLPAAPSGPELKFPPSTYDRSHTELMTGDGHLYRPQVPDCEEGSDDVATLQEGQGSPIDLHGLLPDCIGVGTVENFGSYMLVGGAEDGDYPSVVSPVLALDAQGHKVIRSFDFAASIIRQDPYTSLVWLVGPTGIMSLDSNLGVKENWFFYFGFRPGDHALALLLSDKPREDDALAVAGDDLRVPDWQAWYKAVTALPAAARESFELYAFVMVSPGASYGYQSRDLNTLVPFFLDAATREKDPNRIGFLVNNLCRFDDPRVTDYMNKQVAEGSPQSNMAEMCLQGRARQSLKTPGS